jgi:hypothetical protein
VFTKCSQLEGPDRTVVHSLKRDPIPHQAEDSLRRRFNEPQLTRNLDLVARLKKVADHHYQVDPILTAANLQLTHDALAALQEVPAESPVP